jgi:hypothetical protein
MLIHQHIYTPFFSSPLFSFFFSLFSLFPDFAKFFPNININITKKKKEKKKKKKKEEISCKGESGERGQDLQQVGGPNP